MRVLAYCALKVLEDRALVLVQFRCDGVYFPLSFGTLACALYLGSSQTQLDMLKCSQHDTGVYCGVFSGPLLILEKRQWGHKLVQLHG